MNEDEAFIRAIVDSPGDDTPRLVYADWLDDHDDPRGPYLRAEREATVTGDIADLRELAAGLDPVWVARVSRPPTGVCCDHVRFSNRGPVLSSSAIDKAEAELAIRLPYRLRALLLNYNGGEPSPSSFVPGWVERDERDDPDDYVAVGPFVCMDPSGPLDLVDATRSCRKVGMPKYLVPLALVPDASALVVEVARGSGRGRVFYWDNAVNEYDGDAISFQAASVADFLATLTHT